MSKFLEFTVFIEKIDACSGVFPDCLEVGIPAVSLLFAYLEAMVNSLDGRRRRSIRQSPLVCLWDGRVPFIKGGKRGARFGDTRDGESKSQRSSCDDMGRRMVKVVPLSTSLATLISPP